MMFRKESFFNENGVFAVTDKYRFLRLRESDKSEYMRLCISNSRVALAYTLIPEFYESMWNEANDDEKATICIWDNVTDALIGDISFRHLSDDIPEFGIDIFKEFQRKGIGELAVRTASEVAKTRLGLQQLVVNIYSDNAASLALFSKFHIKEIGRADSEFVASMKQINGERYEEVKNSQPEYRELYEREEHRQIVEYIMTI